MQRKPVAEDDRRLEIFGEFAIAVDPYEVAFDHPAARRDDEADLIASFSTISTAMRMALATLSLPAWTLSAKTRLMKE